MGREDEIVSERLKKIEEMKKKGIKLYPNFFDKKNDISECLKLKLKTKVKTAGRLISKRDLGKIVFGTVAGDIHDIGKNIVSFMLDIAGFEFNSSEDVRAEALGGTPEFVSGLDNGIDAGALKLAVSVAGLERIADVPIHFADGLVRRAPALQRAGDSAAPTARMNATMLAKLGLAAGEQARVGAGGAATVVLTTQLDAGLPDGTVRIAAAHAATVALGAMSSVLSVEKA